MRLLLLALSLAAAPVVADEQIINTPIDTLVWASNPEGVAFAPLSGDRFSGSYYAMVRLPAGTVSPLHIKSARMYGVMIEGQMTHAANGAEVAPIGPGGYYEIPANLPHVSACVSKVPCLTMLYQDGAFDFVPVLQ